MFVALMPVTKTRATGNKTTRYAEDARAKPVQSGSPGITTKH